MDGTGAGFGCPAVSHRGPLIWICGNVAGAVPEAVPASSLSPGLPLTQAPAPAARWQEGGGGHGLHPEGNESHLWLDAVGQPLAAQRRGVNRGPTASSSQLSFPGVDFLLFLWQMHMEGDLRNM